jgi:dCMP deaminase
MNNDLIETYLRIAYQTATKNSHDDSTQVGAVVVLNDVCFIAGVNRFSSYLQNNSKNLERSRKYPRIIHAERDVVYNAAKYGYSLKGTIMVCPWATCPECAQAIVASGIGKVYAHSDALVQTPERWKESLDIGKEILFDGGVEFIQYSGKIGNCENLFDGEVWYP